MSNSSSADERDAERAFEALAAACALRFGAERGEPLVSIIVPVFGNWAFTQRCIEAIVRCGGDAPSELIVIDDASEDETPRRLLRLPGVHVVRNGVNVGFVRGCNRGAAIARGRYIFFLNNDAEIQPGAIDALLRRIERDERIGIAGSRLIYPDGTLQEAGGIIWSDGFAWNYGRLEDVRRPEYAFVRDVDYVSGAALMVRTGLFREVGFDERYMPAYYEDADLCFEVRRRGLRVVYEPASVVVHHEGVTAGHDVNAGAKRFYEINRPKFVSKWYDVLKRDHRSYDEVTVRRAARGRGDVKPAVLVIAEHVAGYGPDTRAGSLGETVRALVRARHRVVFLPNDLAGGGDETVRLQDDGVEVLYRTEGDARGPREHLVEALSTVRAVLIDGDRLCRRYLPAVRAAAGVPVIYRATGAVDLACATAADGTVAETAADADRIRSGGDGPVVVGEAVALIEMLFPAVRPPEPPPRSAPAAIRLETEAAPAAPAGAAPGDAGRERDRLTVAVAAARAELERELAAHRMTRRREVESQLVRDEARAEAARLATELEQARWVLQAEADRSRELLRHVVEAQAAADALAAEHAAAVRRAANAEAERDRTLLELNEAGGIAAALAAEHR